MAAACALAQATAAAMEAMEATAATRQKRKKKAENYCMSSENMKGREKGQAFDILILKRILDTDGI